MAAVSKSWNVKVELVRMFETRHRIIVDGKKMLYSRYTMEQHLGRKLLPDELVHHINEDVTDDRIENLQIMTPKEHSRLHNTGKDNPMWSGGRKVSYRRYRQKHRKERAEYMRKYQQEHKKEKAEYMRKYRQKRRCRNGR